MRTRHLVTFGLLSIALAATGCTGTTTDAQSQPPSKAPSVAPATVSPSSPAPSAAQGSVQVLRGEKTNNTECVSTSCGYVAVTTSGFAGDVTCRIVESRAGAFGDSWTQGPNETHQTSIYYGYSGTNIAVSCDGVTGSTTWPS